MFVALLISCLPSPLSSAFLRLYLDIVFSFCEFFIALFLMPHASLGDTLATFPCPITNYKNLSLTASFSLCFDNSPQFRDIRLPSQPLHCSSHKKMATMHGNLSRLCILLAYRRSVNAKDTVQFIFRHMQAVINTPRIHRLSVSCWFGIKEFLIRILQSNSHFL